MGTSRWTWSAWTGSTSTPTCPICRSAGRSVSFLTAHLGYPIPSPAIFNQIGTAFRQAVGRFADDEHIPVVRFAKHDRKIDRDAPLPGRAGRGRAVRGGRDRGGPGVRARCSSAPTRRGPTGAPWFSFAKADRRVTLLLLLPLGRRLRPGVHQDLLLLPVPGQDLGQRARVGQAPSHPGRDRVHRAVQRVRRHRRPRRAAGHLRPARPGPRSPRSPNAGSPSCRCR